MTQILAEKAKQRPHTHRVTVEFTLPADSTDHAEMVIENSTRSVFFDTEVVNSEEL